MKSDRCECNGCKRRRYSARARYWRKMGMKRKPPRPVLNENQPRPCACKACVYRAEYRAARWRKKRSEEKNG